MTSEPKGVSWFLFFFFKHWFPLFLRHEFGVSLLFFVSVMIEG